MAPDGYPTGTLATEAARVGYEGYGNWAGWKTFDGRDMPVWDELPLRTRSAWVAAAGAVTRLASTLPHRTQGS